MNYLITSQHHFSLSNVSPSVDDTVRTFNAREDSFAKLIRHFARRFDLRVGPRTSYDQGIWGLREKKLLQKKMSTIKS